MGSRPEGLGEWYAARFQDQSVVDRYHLRPTYPAETFEILSSLIVDEPRRVLDAGCGPGNLTRPLAAYVEQIDAVDISRPMLARARTLSGGDSPKIRWLLGRVEDVDLQPPYTLITAGESIHWMDWDVILPRFAGLLTSHGVLAIVSADYQQMPPWYEAYIALLKRFSNNPKYVPIDLMAEFEKRRLFQRQGEATTAPEPLRQSIEDWIAAQHARSSLSLDTMTSEQAAQFDAEMREALLPFAQDGFVTMQIAGHIVWGKPLAPVEGV